MGRGATNKRKGSNAERLYAQIFRDLGFSFCKTARQTSRMLDDAGIDLNFLPFNVQIKAGFHRNMNTSKVLNIIDERLPTMFPPEDPIHKKINVLIHRNQIGPGNKRVFLDDLVYISYEDFLLLQRQVKYTFDIIVRHGSKRGWIEKTLLKERETALDIKVLKHVKNKQLNKYSTLAIMSFDDFTKIIKEIKWQ